MEYFKKNGVPRGTPDINILFWIRNVSRETSETVEAIDWWFWVRRLFSDGWGRGYLDTGLFREI